MSTDYMYVNRTTNFHTGFTGLIFFRNKQGPISTAPHLRVWSLRTKEEEGPGLHTGNREFLG